MNVSKKTLTRYLLTLSSVGIACSRCEVPFTTDNAEPVVRNVESDRGVTVGLSPYCKQCRQSIQRDYKARMKLAKAKAK